MARAVRKVYPRRMPIISSYRIWSRALKEGGISDIREILKLQYDANRFNFFPEKPRMFDI
jgi:hypothetical protein